MEDTLNGKRSLVMTISIFLSLALLISIGTVKAATSLLDDAFFPGSGALNFLNAQSDGADSCSTKTSTAVWKFDLSGVGAQTVASAEFTVRVTSSGSLNGNTRLNLVAINDTSWSDTDISPLSSTDVGSVIEFKDIANGSQPAAGTTLVFNSSALATYMDSAGSAAAIGIQVANCDGGGSPAIQFTSQEGGTPATLVLRNPTNIQLNAIGASNDSNGLVLILAILLPLFVGALVFVLRLRQSSSN